MLIPNLRLKFKKNQTLLEKNLTYCRMLAEGYFLLPAPSYLVTQLESLKYFYRRVKLLFQSKIHKKVILSRILVSFRVKYSKNRQKTQFGLRQLHIGETKNS
jgi:hypothetical protein